MRRPLVLGLVLVAASGCGGNAETRAIQPKSTSNYRVLSEADSKRLVRFASAFYACISKQTDGVGEPRVSRTRIVMALKPEARGAETLRRMTACGESLGDPPKDASLITNGKVIELYLPKQCLLDAKVAAEN